MGRQCCIRRSIPKSGTSCCSKGFDRVEEISAFSYRLTRYTDLDMKQPHRLESANLRRMTRILLVPIVLVPILWVWPQRGMTVAFYTNPHWRNEPAIVRVERQINLDFMTADSASLPQQEFSVEWSGWLRTDRGGQYAFSTRTDDGSTIEIDGHVVVDNGGVHLATRRTATIALTPGLHQIRLRFLQATGLYEFHASWTPPGETIPSALPTQQLFVDRPPAVIVFLTRRVFSLWVLCWFALAL